VSADPAPASTIPTAVIWDMGGIMYRCFTELMVEVGRAQGWPLERMPMGPTGLVPDPNYEAMDRGEFSEPEYVQRLAAALAKENIAFSPYRDIDFSEGDRPQTWVAIERLQAAGFQQALLTNDASRWLGERWWETWEHRRFFDAVVDVKTIGIRKPAPEPYLACVSALSISAKACLFIDDMHVNCTGAQAVGMQSFWFDWGFKSPSANRRMGE